MIRNLFEIYTLVLLITYTTSNTNCYNIFNVNNINYAFNFNIQQSQIQSQHIEILKDSKIAEGTVNYSICGAVNLPAQCGNTEITAKLVFVPADSNNKNCIVVNEPEDWKFEFDDSAANKDVVVRSKDAAETSLVYTFICDKLIPDIDTKVVYLYKTKSFNINVISAYGCPIDTTPSIIFKVSSLIKILFTTAFGFIMCYMGLKAYHQKLGLIIGFFMAFTGAIIYTMIAELYNENTKTIKPLLFTTLSLMVVLIFIVFITTALPILFCLFTVLALVYETRGYIQRELNLSDSTFVILLILAGYSIPCIYLYIKYTDYFIITSTAFIGSFSLLIALRLSGLIPDADNSGSFDKQIPFFIYLLVFWVTGSAFQFLALRSKPHSIENSDYYMDDEFES